MLDTAAVRRHWLFEPNLKATWKPSRKAALELNYGWSTYLPGLLQTIGYRDNTDPLFVAEGNPDLKNCHANDLSLKLSVVDPTRQLSLGTTLSLNVSDRQTVSALAYDPVTGIYTSRPMTAKGSRVLGLQVNYDHGLGEKWRLQNDLKMNAERHYGYLTLLPDETERTLNRQSALHPKDKLLLTFDINWLQTKSFVEIDANRLHFSASPEQNTTLWSNKIGVESEAKWRNFEFSTSLTERMRRGYTMSDMNRDWLEWDAKITWKVLSSKARITLELRDILNSETVYWSDQTAYQQVTQWAGYRHHWIGISFAYHLDAKKKD
ncbi:MAG: TonB-dependent receptor [Muribaculaceae bacterium]|nr:TonB-dependent receptor [Muribaculaceae bacterium]